MDVRLRTWIFLGVDLLFVVLFFSKLRYAYEPSPSNVISRTRANPEAYSLWDRSVTESEAHGQPGAVKVDDALLRLGRRSFYKETFGNEVFLTDVVGVLNGPLQITQVAKAILKLDGKGTTNLRVEVPYTVRVGNRTFQKGSYFETGLDVPRGGVLPLGMAVSLQRGKIRIGITCALCHATVDPVSKKVIEGAPNNDLNAGLLIALGTNSAAYFMHTDVHPLLDVPQTANHLPNGAALENAVDAALLMWPRGNFDSLTDLKADPTQNPSSYTWNNHPYGWSGNFMAGPFRGLTSQNNNVHALNSDSFLLAASSPTLFGIDTDTYLAVLLQNAPNARYRFDPKRGMKASVFFKEHVPSGSFNQVVLPPTYPKGTLLSPDGTLTSSPGFHFWQQNNAMAAWQDTLVPPPVPLNVDAATKTLGRQAFERAGCAGCHAGPFLTNHQIIPASTLGVNPVRASALQRTESNFTQPVIFGFDMPVPLPAHPQTMPVPTGQLDPHQVDLGWAHHGSEGGYKTPSLVGLYWTAPYLHDGGVAVGPNAASDLGLPGTVERNVAPDPRNSLRALIDRDLRQQVVAANHASPELLRVNVEGVGHSFWIDGASGFTAREQQAVIDYLLTFRPNH